VTTLADLQAKNRSGKAALTLPAGARVLAPVTIGDAARWVAAVSNEGRLLLFPLEELPSLTRGARATRSSVYPPPARASARNSWWP
jgi:topoisomerase-4 subunit A